MPNGDKKPVVINNQVRQAFNDYVMWLRGKGMAGKPELDKNGLGKKYLADYIKENPKTILTPDLIAPIQQDLLKYKDYALNQVRLGKAVFQSGVNADNFMQDLSPEDGYGGSRTTSHIYPREYLNYLDAQNNLLQTKDLGFATTQNK
jgi:hypothetical protein